MASFDLTENVTLNAQASQGFRLGGANDPINETLCRGQDIRTFGGIKNYDVMLRNLGKLALRRLPRRSLPPNACPRLRWRAGIQDM